MKDVAVVRFLSDGILVVGHRYYAWYLVSSGRVEEGLRETRLALDLDPLSVETLGLAAQNEYFAHRYDLAIADLRKALRSRSIAAWR